MWLWRRLSVDAKAIQSGQRAPSRLPIACYRMAIGIRFFSRVIGGQHERKRAPVAGGIARRRLAAIERGEEGLLQLRSGRSEYIQRLSGQCRESLSVIEASTSTRCSVEVDKGASRRRPDSGGAL